VHGPFDFVGCGLVGRWGEGECSLYPYFGSIYVYVVYTADNNSCWSSLYKKTAVYLFKVNFIKKGRLEAAKVRGS
jgi:hypothetical protein